MKRSKVTTFIQCPSCHKTDVLAGRDSEGISYECCDCKYVWSVKSNTLVFNQVELPNGGMGICVFWGAWAEFEKKCVKQHAFSKSKRRSEEWCWYKGRHFYTAWKLGEKKVLVYKGTNLLTLVGKVSDLTSSPVNFMGC